MDDYQDIALAILDRVRLFTREEEHRWAMEVNDHCHVWGDFYGPATSRHLARALAHRYLDRQGGNGFYLQRALDDYGSAEEPNG
ncbi:MAG: hypothetical protein MUQ56_08805 [Thermoleophilia bacterium]|nr:hypothetical protein [Thermoleophilia bacterium]